MTPEEEQKAIELEAKPVLFAVTLCEHIGVTIAMSIVLYLYRDEPCDTPLITYIFCNLVLYAIQIPVSIVKFRTARAGQFPKNTRKLAKLVSLAWVVTWILGNVWWFGSDTCQNTNSPVYNLTLVLIIWGYIVIALPFALLLLFVCCLPCIVVFMEKYKTSTASSVLRAIEQRLPVRLFEEQNTEEQTCVICFNAYEKDDELYTLPCKHEMHKACADQWFYQKTTCPLCRLDVSQHVENQDSMCRQVLVD